MVVVILLAISFGITTANLIEFEEKDSITWVRFTYLVSIIGISVIGWVVATQWYLRSGKNIKIGFVARLSPRLREQWSESRKYLADLSREGQLRDAVSIRLVPPDAVRSENKLRRFVERYRFSLIIEMHDPANASADAMSFTVLNRDAIEDGWTVPTISHIQHVFDRRQAAVTPNRIAKFVARSIEESVIWLATARLVARGDHKLAAPLLLELENRVKDTFGLEERPRAQIRWLYKACFVTQSQFNILDGMPAPEVLSNIETDLEHIVKFDPDDAGLVLPLARVQFFRGKVEDAVKSVERARVLKLNSHQSTIVSVDSGFLNLIASNFDQAARDFNALIDLLSEVQFSMEDLVAFADLCHEMQYPHTSYVRDLYRVMADKPVPKDIAAAASAWLQQDQSRTGLSEVRARAKEKVLSMRIAVPKKRAKAKVASQGRVRKQRRTRKRGKKRG